MAGERDYGITWHLMTDAVDAGDIVLQRRFPISDDDTSLTLNTRCFEAGVESFPELVDLLTSGDTAPVRQVLERATYCGHGACAPAIDILDWSRPVGDLAALVRALDFGTYTNPLALPTLVAGDRVVVAGALVSVDASDAAPGTVLMAEGGALGVAARGGALRLTRLATSDGTRLTAAEALSSLGVAVGGVLEPVDAERLTALASFAERAARFDGSWAVRLSTLDPLELPYVERATARAAERTALALPAVADRDLAAATFVVFVARLGGRARFDLAWHEQGVVGADAVLRPFVAQSVPVRVAFDERASVRAARAAVAQDVSWVRRRVGFRRDIVVRRPALRALAGREFSLPIGVELVERLDERSPSTSDLSLVIARDGSACLDFDASVLDPVHVATMASQFTAALIADPDSPWTALPLLSAADRNLVVETWATAPRDLPGDLCVHDLIAAQAARTPDAVAAIFEESQLTYRELDARGNQFARHLRDRGAGPDTLVALCCERSLDMLIAILGIHKAGAAYVPVDLTYPTDRVAYMLEDAQARLVVTQLSVLGDLPDTQAQLVCVDRDWPIIARQSAEPVASGVGPSNLAYCIYTSGSTGHPKGVMVEHRNVVNFFGAMDERLGTEPGTWLAVTSLSFDISVLELLWTLSRGYKVVIYADEHRAAGPARGLANADKGVGFSLFYFSADENENTGDRYRLLMEGARFADTHGFTAVWTPERHFHAFGGLYPNPAVTGAALAAVTTRIGVRAGSCVLPLHHPVRVAEEWAVVDNLSGGRVGVSFASGWQPNDFILQPGNYADAKQRTIEMIDTVRRLWRGETLAFTGPRGDVQVRTLPRPVQAELPIWYTTAGNPESYELAGTLGLNVLTHLLGQSVDELADKIRLYRRARTAAGHPGAGDVSLMLHTFVGEHDEDVKALVRGPMKAYLRTSISLIKGLAAAFPTFKKGADGRAPELDFESLAPEEMDALLDYSFERYYESSGLFGTVETCARLVDRLKGIGVDDIACLIDFGVDGALVLRHLTHLNRLRAQTSRPRTASAEHSLAAQMVRHRVTHLQCTPSMAGMLVGNDRSRDALRNLRTMCVGGEPFPPALAKVLQRLVPGDIHNMYGPTETTIWSSMHTLGVAVDPVSLGTPLANNELYVLDAFRQPVPPGVPGELYIGGAQVARGYWRRPELTAERFVPNPFRGAPSARLYRTGDLVRWPESGGLEFLGRVDFQVKLRGFRIELGEIEAALAAHPAVREAVVMARDDAHDGDVRLVAYVVWHTPPEDAVRVLRDHLRGALPEFMVPAQFVVLRDLPRTPNAKVDRRALPSPADVGATPLAAGRPVAPAGALEASIASVWREVLRLPAVSVQDNFFDLGGHSLLAVQVHSRLKQALPQNLSITDLFRFPTIRGLAAYLSRTEDGAAARRGEDRAAQRKKLSARLPRPTTDRTLAQS